MLNDIKQWAYFIVNKHYCHDLPLVLLLIGKKQTNK